MKVGWKLIICFLTILILSQYIIIGKMANDNGKVEVEVDNLLYKQVKRTLVTEKILFDSGLWPAGVKIPEGALWRWEDLIRVLNMEGPAKREPYYEPKNKWGAEE